MAKKPEMSTDTAPADALSAPAASAAPEAAIKAAPTAVEEDVDVDLTPAECMPEAAGRQADPKAFELLLAACERFNVDPRITTRPRELAAWRFYPGDTLDGVDPSVVIVTAGGVKLRHFDGQVQTDEETDERLRQIFGAYQIDKVTKQLQPLPLPENQTLPLSAVTGQVVSVAHRHQGGFLRRARA